MDTRPLMTDPRLDWSDPRTWVIVGLVTLAILAWCWVSTHPWHTEKENDRDE